MNARVILLSQGRIRPLWRFFLSAGAIFLAVVLVGLAVGFVFGGLAGKPPGFFTAQASSSLLLFLALLGIFKILCLVFERRPLGSTGLALGGRWRAELALGLVVGTLMILAVAGLEYALGSLHFSLSPEAPARQAGWGLGLLAVLALAAANEEMTFRGYPFQRLIESIGPVGAIVVLSALFGAIHLGNPNHTWASTANTMLVGVPLSIAYLRTRMLWLPIGVHFAWNFVQGFVLGLPVSGIQFPVSLLRAEVSGREWLTGGSYGPEGGVVTLAVVLLATGYLALSKRIYMSEETKSLVFGPLGASRPPARIFNLSEPAEPPAATLLDSK
jgi:hypothetical protein